MRIKIPKGLRRDQIYIVIGLGLISGYFNWNPIILQELSKTTSEKSQPK